MRTAEDAQKEVNHKMQARQNTLHALLSERDIPAVVPSSPEAVQQPTAAPKGRYADPAASFGSKT